jgi:hypothetical protein
LYVPDAVPDPVVALAGTSLAPESVALILYISSAATTGSLFLSQPESTGKRITDMELTNR